MPEDQPVSQDAEAADDPGQKESSFSSYLKEQGMTEDQFYNEFSELKEKNQRLSREYADLQADVEDKQRQESRPELPTDAKQFFDDFVKEPNQFLQKFVDSRLEKYDHALGNYEKQLAMYHVTSQKDYFDGMEDDLADIIRDNRSMYFTLDDGSRSQMSKLSPFTKVQAALQILREKRNGQRTKESQKPVKVATPEKSPGTLDKSVTEMNAKEMRDYLLQQGARIAEEY